MSTYRGSSPHTRGARDDIVVRLVHIGIIPAYAGSTFPVELIDGVLEDHPRIRGEHVAGFDMSVDLTGSSPHTRGARSQLLGRTDDGRIIPAYAGSTTRAPLIASHSSDHPRIRGEHAGAHTYTPSRPGSSPHTRGAPDRRQARQSRHGIIPAYAGSTLGNPCNTKDRRRDYTSFPLPVTHPSGGGGS